MHNRVFPDIKRSHIIHNYRLHLLAAALVRLRNERGNKRQVSHTYSVTRPQPIKQLAVIRAQQLGLSWALAEAHSQGGPCYRQESVTCMWVTSRCWYSFYCIDLSLNFLSGTCYWPDKLTDLCFLPEFIMNLYYYYLFCFAKISCLCISRELLLTAIYKALFF